MNDLFESQARLEHEMMHQSQGQPYAAAEALAGARKLLGKESVCRRGIPEVHQQGKNGMRALFGFVK